MNTLNVNIPVCIDLVQVYIFLAGKFYSYPPPQPSFLNKKEYYSPVLRNQYLQLFCMCCNIFCLGLRLLRYVLDITDRISPDWTKLPTLRPCETRSDFTTCFCGRAYFVTCLRHTFLYFKLYTCFIIYQSKLFLLKRNCLEMTHHVLQTWGGFFSFLFYCSNIHVFDFISKNCTRLKLLPRL